MADWMPPLPEPDGYMRHTPVWAEDSMRQAMADAARAALEQAAKVCEETADDAIDDYEAGGAYYCLTAIRALAKEIT